MKKLFMLFTILLFSVSYADGETDALKKIVAILQAEINTLKKTVAEQSTEITNLKTITQSHSEFINLLKPDLESHYLQLVSIANQTQNTEAELARLIRDKIIPLEENIRFKFSLMEVNDQNHSNFLNSISLKLNQTKIRCTIVYRGNLPAQPTEAEYGAVEYNKTCPSGYQHIMNAQIYSAGHVPQWQSLCCQIYY